MSRLGGICRDRPRARKSGRRMGLGVVGTAWSSLLVDRESFSRKLGEGARVEGLLAAGVSENERVLEGVREGEAVSGGCRDGLVSIIGSIVQFSLYQYIVVVVVGLGVYV